MEETILENVRNLSALFGYNINVVHDELCYDEPCPYYQKCRRSLKYVKNSKVRKFIKLMAKVCQFRISTVLKAEASDSADS